LLTHAIVRLSVETVTTIRRTPIQGHGETFSPSTLKHFDEQTIAVLVALQDAIRAGQLAPEHMAHPFRDWGVLAAPRFLGRAHMGLHVVRFLEEGAWGLSPHLVPYRSLHSLSGTVSQFLKAQGPNFGVGGGPGSEEELLLVGVSLLASMPIPGLWLLFSRIEPEGLPRDEGRPHPDASCQALVLALSAVHSGKARARLDISITESNAEQTPAFDFDILRGLLDALPQEPVVSCRLSGGRQLILTRNNWPFSGSPISLMAAPLGDALLSPPR
jgi:hypothetical protein